MFDRRALLTVSLVSLFGVIQLGALFPPSASSETEHAYLAMDDDNRLAGYPNPAKISIGRASDGLFHITALINGKPLDMAVDTGATRTVISPDDAARLGLSANTGRYSNMETINGEVRLSRARIDSLSLGNQDIRGLEIVLGPAGLNQSVIGLDAISRGGPVLLDGNRLTLLSAQQRTAGK